MLTPTKKHSLANRKKPCRNRKHLRLCIVDCPSPLDAMAGRSEGASVAAIARLIGHEVLSYAAISGDELKKICHYVASASTVADEAPGTPLCLHLSAHGNNHGVMVGGDSLPWSDLAAAVSPVITAQYDGPCVIVLSCCLAENQAITKAIEKAVASGDQIKPPRFLFCTEGEVTWDSAAVAWAIFYHLLPKADLDDKASVQAILDSIKKVGVADLLYFRWDKATTKYLKYTAR